MISWAGDDWLVGRKGSENRELLFRAFPSVPSISLSRQSESLEREDVRSYQARWGREMLVSIPPILTKEALNPPKYDLPYSHILVGNSPGLSQILCFEWGTFIVIILHLSFIDNREYTWRRTEEAELILLHSISCLFIG